jgi:hypothetical protein
LPITKITEELPPITTALARLQEKIASDGLNQSPTPEMEAALFGIVCLFSFLQTRIDNLRDTSTKSLKASVMMVDWSESVLRGFIQHIQDRRTVIEVLSTKKR